MYRMLILSLELNKCSYTIISKNRRNLQTSEPLRTVNQINLKYEIEFHFQLSDLIAGDATIFNTTMEDTDMARQPWRIPGLYVNEDSLNVRMPTMSKMEPMLFKPYKVKTNLWYKLKMKQTDTELVVDIKDDETSEDTIIYKLMMKPEIVYNRVEIMPPATRSATGFMKKLYLKSKKLNVTSINCDLIIM